MKQERNQNICKLYQTGDTMTEIGKKYNLTNERVSQILRENAIRIKRRSETKNKYKIVGDIVEIQTAKGETLLIDKQDIERVSKYSWCIGAKNRVVANINGKVNYLHRFILENPNGVVDHINGNNRDNRRCNLRITDAKGNARNNISHNKYGVNGIRKTPAGNYQARITVNYKEINVGTFKTLEEAQQARKEAEAKHFGEYAPTKRYQ